MVYIHTMESFFLLFNKKGLSIDEYYDMNETWKDDVRWKNPIINHHDFIY